MLLDGRNRGSGPYVVDSCLIIDIGVDALSFVLIVRPSLSFLVLNDDFPVAGFLFIPVDFAVIACAFGPVKDSMIRVSVVANRWYSVLQFFLLRRFVRDASLMDALSPIRSEVSWVVRIVW